MAGMVSRQWGMRNVRGGAVCQRPLPSIPHSAFHTPHSIYGTKMLPDPLFPSLEAVPSANPAPTARTITVWPNAPSIRATEESLTVHDTARPERTLSDSSVARIERSEEHTSELQSPCNLVCRLLLEKKK